MRLLIAALLLLPATVFADYGTATVERVTSIYDGDTFRADIRDWPAVVGERIPIRIQGISAPERRSRCETEAEKERERELAAEVRIHLVERLRGAREVELRQIERGSFFRLLADVYVDGVSLGDEMLQMGLALPYQEGQGGKAWCGR